MDDIDLFTRRFRKWLKNEVRTCSPAQAKVLSVKLSPIFSLTVGAVVLLNWETYTYQTLIVVMGIALILGGLFAYAASPWIMKLMWLLTLEAHDRLGDWATILKAEDARKDRIDG